MNRHRPSRHLLRDLLVSLAVILLAGVVLAALGPFGSFGEGRFADRLGYWLPAVGLGFLIFRPIAWLGDRASRSLDLPRPAAMAFAVLLAALPGTLAIAWLNGALRGGPPPLGDLAPLYLNVALIGGLITSIFLAMERRGPAEAAASGGDEASAAPGERAPFLDRLPPGWGDTLTALQMEDHYVRAHGPDGRNILILLRMADAERELAGIEGMRIHRSWWVARSAVEGRRRDGRRLLLMLRGGLVAPVARDRTAALRAAGWL